MSDDYSTHFFSTLANKLFSQSLRQAMSYYADSAAMAEQVRTGKMKRSVFETYLQGGPGITKYRKRVAHRAKRLLKEEF